MRKQNGFLPARTLLILSILAPAFALLIAVGCGPSRQVIQPTPPLAVTADSTQYVGNAVCAQCHQAEFDLHRASRHANTMRPVERLHGDHSTPPSGSIPNSDYAIREQSGGLRFERIDEPSVSAAIRFALGSGKDAVTYVGEFGAEKLTEYRMTYLPARSAWCVTPGQGSLSNLDLGKVHERGMARRCILCHAVKTTPGSSEPAEGFLGVGCESCHGPGKPHVEAIKSGHAADPKMDDMRQWTAEKIDAVCTRCHRSLDNVPIEKDIAGLTARFQGYGLEQSQCFRKSEGRLSCVTCHNPHTNVSTDRRSYEKICLSCHTPTGSTHNKQCPVNAREQCITCHMPERQIFPNRRIPIKMADHLILAYSARH